MPVSHDVFPGGGGDYTSLQAWENAQDGTALDQKTARCDDSGDLGSLNMTGWSNTPDVSNQVFIINDAAGDLHSLTQASGSSSARVTTDIAARNLLLQEPYTTVDGLYLDNSGFTATSGQIEIRDDNITIKNCYLYHNPDTNIGAIMRDATARSPLTVENTAIWVNNGTNLLTSTIDERIDDLDVTNCVLYLDGTAATQRGLRNNSGTQWDVYSTYVGGAYTDNWNNVSGGFGGDYNAQDDADADMPGANSVDNAAEADQFTDHTNGDFTLKSGSDLEDAGDPTNSTATSFDGTTRSSPDIGPDEFASAPAITVPEIAASVAIVPPDVSLPVSVVSF